MDGSNSSSASKKKGKKRRRSGADAASSIVGAGGAPAEHAECGAPTAKIGGSGQIDAKRKVRTSDYPYPTDYNDHFETPARAYDDIFPLMERAVQSRSSRKGNGKKSPKGKRSREDQEDGSGGGNGDDDAATVYDPYYCAGRAATLLKDVFRRHCNSGAPVRVQHEKRDFYRDIRQSKVPRHDVLVTNPPYSGNHKERCLEFAVDQLKRHGRPFFLLMPNYVAMKEYFRKIVLDGGVRTFYVTPPTSRPYEYDHPEGTGHATVPFASVWFCGLSCGEAKQADSDKSIMEAFAKFHSSRASPAGAPRIVASLQELIRTGGVSGERRKNPRQRKKMRQQAMERANNAAAGGGSSSDGNARQPPSNKRKHGGNGAEQGNSDSRYKNTKKRRH